MTEVGKLKAEIDALRTQLEASGGGGGAISAEQQTKMQKMIDDNNYLLKQSFEEKERLAQVPRRAASHAVARSARGAPLARAS
jgi:hypothetical protein